MAPKLPIKQVILKKAAGVPEPAFPPSSSSARPTSRLDAAEKISSGVKGPDPLVKAYHHKKPSDPAVTHWFLAGLGSHKTFQMMRNWCYPT